MAWNSGGGGPWGGPGGGPPQGPPSGGRPPGSPWGGRRRPQLPDPEQLLARFLAWLRGLLGGKLRGGLPRGGLPSGPWSTRRLAAIGAAIVVIAWLISGFYVVQPDQQGVVLRFGAFTGTTAPGLNYHLPWPIESVLLPAVTRVNRVEIGYRATPGQPSTATPVTAQEVPAESLMLTGDQNIVDINFTVFWRIRDAKQFLFDIRHPEPTIKAVAESVMREVVGHNPIEPLLTTARAAIETQVRHDMQAILNQYNAGVEITEVQLLKVDPPPEVIDSFRDVQRAGTDADRARNNAEAYRNDIVPRARGDAARIVAEAEATKAADIVAATGDSERFLSVLAAYRAAKAITLRRLYIETMEQVLEHARTVVLAPGADRVLPLLPLSGAAALPVPAPSPAPSSAPSSPGTARPAP
jgi:modulator of FtsH protease HflK